MILEIGLFIASPIIGYAINKGLDHVFKKKPETYRLKLGRVIDNTIEAYSKNHYIKEEEGKFPFYKSQIIIEV